MPKVSVILPVYNTERFLRSAIDSILQQTFSDFELLLINDGSTDGCDAIIRTYTDARIVYRSHEKNRGLIATLNEGIDVARGEYIARMDGDDVALPGRLQAQVDWLDRHPATAVVGCFSTEIDETGTERGYFAPDRAFVTAAQIRRRLPYLNCLTHPSVMGRTAVLHAYKYSETQKNIEDYDLWLRLAADGYALEKVPESLLLYRVHATSITQSKLRNRNFFWKHFHCKRRYLAQRLTRGRLNAFDRRVAAQMLLDAVRALAKDSKEALKKQ